MLPAGDGYLVVERLKAMPALEGIPVIVVSARHPVAEEERFIESGADAFFRKPFDHDELRDRAGVGRRTRGVVRSL